MWKDRAAGVGLGRQDGPGKGERGAGSGSGPDGLTCLHPDSSSWAAFRLEYEVGESDLVRGCSAAMLGNTCVLTVLGCPAWHLEGTQAILGPRLIPNPFLGQIFTPNLSP